MMLANLKAAVAGKDSHDRVIWTDSLNVAFRSAQLALKIVIPKPSDLLIITNDGVVHNGGIGYVGPYCTLFAMVLWDRWILLC